MSDILIVGIATVDAIARPIDQFPAPGGLRFFDNLTLTAGGNALNSSIALSRLGVKADVVTRIGRDILGDFVLAELGRNGVDSTAIVRDPGANTPFTFVSVASSGERSFLHIKGTNATICSEDIPHSALHAKRFVFVTGTMLMDAFDGSPTADLLRDARAQGAATLLDTVFVEGAANSEWRRRIDPALPHLDYFIPSLPEAQALTGVPEPPRIARNLQNAGVRNVAIKLGEQGVFCRDAGGRESNIPAFQVEQIVDATGAGDCWGAGFLVGLIENCSIAKSAQIGNAVAAYGIQAAGAAAGVRDLTEVREFMRSAPTRPSSPEASR